MNVVNHYPRLFNRAVNLASQLYNGGLNEMILITPRNVWNQIEHEEKTKN